MVSRVNNTGPARSSGVDELPRPERVRWSLWLALLGMLPIACGPPLNSSPEVDPVSDKQPEISPPSDGHRASSATSSVSIPEPITLHEPSLSANAVAFSPDGTLLAAAGHKNNIWLWNLATGDAITWADNRWNSVFFHLAWSSDGERILSFPYGGSAQLWEWKRQQGVRVFGGDLVSNKTGAWSRNERRIALSDWDQAVVLDMESEAEICRLTGHDGPISEVIFSFDDRRVVTGSDDRTVRLWDAETGEELRKLKHRDVVRGLAISRDGKLVAAGLHDLYVWDAETGERIHRFPGSSWSVIFSHDSRKIIAGNRHAVEIRDAGTGKLEATLTGHQEEIFGLDLSPDGKHLASASYDHTIKVWEVGKILADGGR